MKDDLKKLEDRGWNEMFTLLEKELPTSRKKRLAIWWWSSGIAASILVGSFLLLNDGGTVEKNNLSMATNTNQPNLSIPTPKILSEETIEENQETVAAANLSGLQINEKPINSMATLSTPSSRNYTSSENLKYSNSNIDNVATQKSNLAEMTGLGQGLSKVNLLLPNTSKIENKNPHSSAGMVAKESQLFEKESIATTNEFSPRIAIQVPLLNKPSFLLSKDSPSIYPMIKPTSAKALQGGFLVGAESMASLNNVGQIENSLGFGYRKMIGGQISIKAGTSIGRTNLNLAFESVSALNDPTSLLMDKKENNVYQSTNSFSSSTSGKVASKYIVNAHLGLGYAFNNKFLLETTGGIRKHLEESRAAEAQNAVNSGNNTPSPQKANLSLKNHYFQTLDLHYFVNAHLNVKASYLLTGQPINTGFIIDQRIGKVNHFAGLGIEWTF
ncbi:MAG: hypothetical protein IPL23_24850 [Saprospiraceae bacterium]|nr:hypothetical protein [Saprospiraceae bacterium]